MPVCHLADIYSKFSQQPLIPLLSPSYKEGTETQVMQYYPEPFVLEYLQMYLENSDGMIAPPIN